MDVVINESAGPLIMDCLIFGILWQLVKDWIGVYSVDSVAYFGPPTIIFIIEKVV